MPHATTGWGWHTFLVQAIRQLPHRQFTLRVNSLDKEANTYDLLHGLRRSSRSCRRRILGGRSSTNKLAVPESTELRSVAASTSQLHVTTAPPTARAPATRTTHRADSRSVTLRRGAGKTLVVAGADTPLTRWLEGGSSASSHRRQCLASDRVRGKPPRSRVGDRRENGRPPEHSQPRQSCRHPPAPAHQPCLGGDRDFEPAVRPSRR